MMIFSQIAALTPSELLNEVSKTERELLEVTMAIRLQQEKNIAKRKKIRRYLARLKTASMQTRVSSTLTPSAS